MNLLDRGVLLLIKPRVLHSIPGRIRLHVPMLKKVKPGSEQWVPLLAEMLGTPVGIHEVTPCITTGNILLKYNLEQLSESDIVNFLKALTTIFYSHREELERVNGKDPDVIKQRLIPWLQQALSHCLYLDDQLRIPADVFE